MTFGDETPPSMKSRLQERLAQAFPDREILLRSQDQVRYVKLGRRRQLAIAGLGALALAFGLYSSLSYVTSDRGALQAALMAERAAHQQAIAALSDDKAAAQQALQTQLAQAQAALEAAEAQTRHAEARLTQEQTARDAAEAETRLVETRLSQQQAALAEAQAAAAAAESAPSTHPAIESQLAFALAAQRDLAIVLERRTAALLSSEAAHGGAVLTVQNLQARLERSQQRMALLESHLSSDDAALASLRTQEEAAAAEQARLTAELERLGTALAAAEAAGVSQGQRLRSLEEELSLSAAETDTLQRALQDAELHNYALETAHAERKTEIAALESALAETVAQGQQSAQLLDELRQDLAAARQEKARVERREALLSDRRQGLEAQLVGLAAESAAEREELTLALASAEVATEVEAARADSLAVEVQSLEQQLALAQGNAEGLDALLAETHAALDESETRLREMAKERDRLALAMQATQQTLGSVEDSKQALLAERDELRASLTARPTTRSAEQEAIEAEKAQLEGRVGELEEMIVAMRDRQRDIVDRLDLKTFDTMASLEELIGTTGLDVETLLAQVSSDRAQGGPFIPADELLASDVAYELQVSVALLDMRLDRWEALQRLVSALPLDPPLENYRITSKYGYRRDPLNGRRSFHNGIDLAANYKAPLTATADGVVSFTGWRGGYGRVVDVQHGFGIKTRYAHLAKISVKKGDRVEKGELVGLLGSSGRSTGPHVHYEVIFEDTRYDPMNFFRAGRHVQ
ncbi:MAG: peptidoglycan DD-metalloendopeptidase family protein [Pseudomonadota bacterium]